MEKKARAFRLWRGENGREAAEVRKGMRGLGLMVVGSSIEMMTIPGWCTLFDSGDFPRISFNTERYISGD